MSTDPENLRNASRRLAIRFAALIVVLFLVVAGVIVALVATTQHDALTQQLVQAEHLDSPRDAPPGVYVAIAGGGGPGGPQGQGPGGTGGTDGAANIVTSPNAPSGFPDMTTFDRVSRTGISAEQTVDFGGQAYIVRTVASAGRVVQVAIGKSESESELRRVLLAAGLSGVPAIVGAILAAWWMSRRAMRPLADALALQRRFVADAGHELRTPLTLLSTRAQLLRRALPGEVDQPAKAVDPPAPAALREGLDEIVSDAKALTGILEDLLISADPRRDAERVDVDVVTLADEVVAALRTEAGSRGVSLERDGPEPVIVSGVPVSLSRLILALTVNALDHASSRVLLTVTAHEDQARIEVSDDGPGFSQGAARVAFERFASSRPVDVESPGPRHYGLGLALVAEVAHRYDGTVAIVDTGGVGALVRVSLPRRPTK